MLLYICCIIVFFSLTSIAQRHFLSQITTFQYYRVHNHSHNYNYAQHYYIPWCIRPMSSLSSILTHVSSFYFSAFQVECIHYRWKRLQTTIWHCIGGKNITVALLSIMIGLNKSKVSSSTKVQLTVRLISPWLSSLQLSDLCQSRTTNGTVFGRIRSSWQRMAAIILPALYASLLRIV